MEVSGKKKIVIGVDDSEQSVYTLQWILEYLVAPFPGDRSKYIWSTLALLESAFCALSNLDFYIFE